MSFRGLFKLHFAQCELIEVENLPISSGCIIWQWLKCCFQKLNNHHWWFWWFFDDDPNQSSHQIYFWWVLKYFLFWGFRTPGEKGGRFSTLKRSNVRPTDQRSLAGIFDTNCPESSFEILSHVINHLINWTDFWLMSSFRFNGLQNYAPTL